MTIEELAERLYPNKAYYNIKESATLLGLSPQTLYNNKEKYPLSKRNTLEQIKKTAERHSRQQRPANTHKNGIGNRSQKL